MKQIPLLTISQIERFCSKFDISGNGCWLWHAALSADGYGAFGIGKARAYRAHRVAYTLVNGVTERELDHLCRDRACVNPRHLEPVTRSENIKRQYEDNRVKVLTHCRNGHEYSQLNSYTANYPSGTRRVCRVCYRNRVTAKVGLTASPAAL